MLAELQFLARASYYDTYLSYIKQTDILAELDRSFAEFEGLISPLTSDQLVYRYEKGKWSIAQVVQHLIETEMIFNYRAITLCREEELTPMKGFDHDRYAQMAKHGSFVAADWVEFFRAVRTSTKYLFHTFSDEKLDRVGLASGHRVQTRALFYVNSGHTLHHCKVIRERYLR